MFPGHGLQLLEQHWQYRVHMMEGMNLGTNLEHNKAWKIIWLWIIESRMKPYIPVTSERSEHIFITKLLCLGADSVRTTIVACFDLLRIKWTDIKGIKITDLIPATSRFSPYSPSIWDSAGVVKDMIRIVTCILDVAGILIQGILDTQSAFGWHDQEELYF